MSRQTANQPAFELQLSDRVAMSFQLIPADSFQMGSRGEYADEEPTHTVRITQPFYLGTFPVTQREFEIWTQAATVKHENHFSGKPSHPAENMDWNEATSFCDWLSAEHNDHLPPGFVATLPTEAQWEYACRAGTETEYYTGDGEAALAEAGWFDENSGEQTHPVGELAPNAFGLYDMHGNVDEWCRDVWDDDAYKKRVDGVADPMVRSEDVEEEDPDRVFRGGSWFGSARGCRSAFRFRDRPGDRITFLGFRVCLVPGSVPQPSQASRTES
jgi:formylglycine-generating enzyme required for sulfatase activity